MRLLVVVWGVLTVSLLIDILHSNNVRNLFEPPAGGSGATTTTTTTATTATNTDASAISTSMTKNIHHVRQRQQQEEEANAAMKESTSSSTTASTNEEISAITTASKKKKKKKSDINNNNNIQQKNSTLPDGDLQLCFVTCEFSDTLEEADVLGQMTDEMLASPALSFVFTNLDNLPTGGRQRIVQKDLPYNRSITQSRWGKFMGWQHPLLSKCDIVFYGDAYMFNPDNYTWWQHFAHTIRNSDVGLCQGIQKGRNKPNGPILELQHNARIGKDSWTTANYTIQWLFNQTDYDPRKRWPVYKNARFSYDPHNPKYRQFVTDFWDTYSLEHGSWRDQPYWAYYLHKHGIKPMPSPTDRDLGWYPSGPHGKQGHNGHKYVMKTS